MFHIRNWPKQLILSNLYDGNSLKVVKNFQCDPPTLIAFKKMSIIASIFDINIRKFDTKKT